MYAHLLQSFTGDDLPLRLPMDDEFSSANFTESRRTEELMKMMLRLLVRFAELSPVMIVLHLQVRIATCCCHFIFL
jgi:hypothetical protein